MRREGHSALVHTAAASNLGQMLVKLCQKDEVPLVNIVRKPDQEELLRSLGAIPCATPHRRRSREISSRLSKRRPRRLGSTPRAGDARKSNPQWHEEEAASSTAGEYSRYGSGRP